MDSSNFDPRALQEEGKQSVARLMLQIYRNFNAMAHRKYAERGYRELSTVHMLLFAILDLEGTRIVTLAERMGTTKQFAGKLVQELESLGYVQTAPDPTDRRATLVKATDRGWQFLVDACEAKAEIENEFKAVLGAERIGAFVATLKVLAAMNVGGDAEAMDELPG